MSKIAFPDKENIKYKTEIHCRFSIGTINRIAEIAEATGCHMNRTIATLVDLILANGQFAEVDGR